MEKLDPEVREVEVGKAITIDGKSYQPGDIIDTSSLPDHKVTQFLRQRILRPRKPKAPTDPG